MWRRDLKLSFPIVFSVYKGKDELVSDFYPVCTGVWEVKLTRNLDNLEVEGYIILLNLLSLFNVSPNGFDQLICKVWASKKYSL